LEWLTTTEFTFNNKVYIAIKSSLFKVNYGRELRISFKIRKKRKHAKAEEFVKEMKEMHKKVKAVLRKSQKKIKYANRNRKKVVEYKVGDKVLLSMKNLMWQMRNRKMKKWMEKYVGPYKIKKIISENMVKLKLLVLMKIYLVVNISRIVLYQK